VLQEFSPAVGALERAGGSSEGDLDEVGGGVVDCDQIITYPLDLYCY